MPDPLMLFCLSGVALVAAGLIVFGGWVEASQEVGATNDKPRKE